MSDESVAELRHYPGDRLLIPGHGAHLVTSALAARETLDGHEVTWEWLFLEASLEAGDGASSLLELGPAGVVWFTSHEVHGAGSERYAELVAQDGALARFETRVRAHSSQRRPVHVVFEGVAYRVSSTGTFVAERRGPAPRLAPWSALSDRQTDNVYFGLTCVSDPRRLVLGIWTQGISLSFGSPLAGIPDLASPGRSSG